MVSSRDTIIHTPEEIARIRTAAQATAWVRDELAAKLEPGMTTKEVDVLAGCLIAQTGGTSSFLGYHGYPGNVCISVNDVVVHGIGSNEKMLRDGDIVSIDIGVAINGATGDTARTVPLGKVGSDVERLLVNTELALMKGIEQAKAGNHIGDISAAVEKVAVRAGLGVVRDYVGHGCGIKLHEPPEIPNFQSRYRGPRLEPGMVLAIEPMLNLGTWKVRTERDNWTVRTCDGKWSAHFEHLVLVTEETPEILTWPKTM
ncbi:MAG: type I methionyl aminopeptidase [Victivallaceae bacterium]|nr:type I methionyl aminopeptidase [Victivallaceae bacterium]